MIAILKIASVTVLLAICFQDLKYRAVSWYLFPLSALFLLSLTWALNGNPFSVEIIFNLLFVAVNVVVVSMVVLRGKVSIKALNRSFLGLGDILFFIVLALVLPFPLFPVFFIATLLIGVLTGYSFFKGKSIPLAGIQAVMLIPIHMIDSSRLSALNQYLSNSFING